MVVAEAPSPDLPECINVGVGHVFGDVGIQRRGCCHRNRGLCMSIDFDLQNVKM